MSASALTSLREDVLAGPVIVPGESCFVLVRPDGTWHLFDEAYDEGRLPEYRQHSMAIRPPERAIERAAQVSLIVFVSEACNLRCDYCKVSAMITAEHKKKTKPEEIAASIAAVANTIEGQVDVIFYGGEPLMEFRAIDQICESVGRLTAPDQVYFSMTTNGTLLNDEMLQIILRNRICVGVSIDGNPASHDAHRSTAGGKATHQRAVANYRRMKQSGVECGPICVVTDPAILIETFDFLVDNFSDRTVHLKPLEVHGTEDPKKLASYYEQFCRAQLQLLARCVAVHKSGGPRLVETRTLGAVHGILRSNDHNSRTCHTSVGGDCAIGKEILGIEADGKIMPCPNVKKYSRVDDAWIKAISNRAGYCEGCVYRPLCPTFCLAEMDEEYVERFIDLRDHEPVDVLCRYNRQLIDGIFRLYREDPIALHEYAFAS